MSGASILSIFLLVSPHGSAAQHADDGLMYEDVTDAVGLGSDVVSAPIARCLFADLNSDGWADAVVDRYRVFLSIADEESPIGRRFVEVADSGLPRVYAGDCTVFADLDNDGDLDAIVTRYIDRHNESWVDHGERTAWFEGNGDGTFGEKHAFEGVTPATTSAVAVGDTDDSGALDVFLGNWYTKYGESVEGYDNELVQRCSRLGDTVISLPTDQVINVPEISDAGGRPTYGVMIARLYQPEHHVRPMLIELNYGRRWNRLWWHVVGLQRHGWINSAPEAGFDGDSIRHGRYPEWLKERAKDDPRFDREDEQPFRSNGNTFDCSVGDIDNDGDFDIFVSEITHGWAGESSDRSRFLLNNGETNRQLRFNEDARLSVDRIPDGVNNWNQGDLFCELADFNNDTHLDLLLSSGDYPDNQRLRLYLQQDDGTFKDSTEAVGLDHDGSQQISIADVNRDGVLDILVGQTFNRFTPEMREGREPRLRLFAGRLSRSSAERSFLTIRLEGDPEAGANRDTLGAIVMARLGGTTLRRQLIGIGGHAGKQHDFIIHFGLGNAESVDEVTVLWPNAARTRQSFSNVHAGAYGLRQGGELRAIHPKE